ncbi:MAG: glycosyltransferase family 87 protein [Terriglobales bacterium]
MKPLNIKTTVLFYLAGIAVIHLVVLWNVRQMIWKGYSDFTIYYCAGTMVRQGHGHDLYDDVAQFKVQREFAPEVATRLGALPYNHPPFEAVLFTPLTYLPYSVAFVFWDALNLAMLAVLPFLLLPQMLQLQDYPWPLWILVSLTFFPVFFALLQGQDSILLLFLYTLGFVDLAKRHDARAGGWLALGLFKPHLVVPFILFMLLCGRKKILSGFLAAAAALGLLSTAIVGWQGLISYPRYVLNLEATMARGAIVPSDMPNLRGVLYLLLRGWPHVGVVTVAFSACIFLLGVWQSHKLDSAILFDWQFAFAVVTTVIVSYHCLGYDLSILILPVVLLCNEIRRGSRFREWSSIVIVIAVSLLFFSPLQLLLLLRFNRLALVGWVVLLLTTGIAGQISARTRLDSLNPSTP